MPQVMRDIRLGSAFGVLLIALMSSGCVPGGGGDEQTAEELGIANNAGVASGPVVPGGGVTPSGLSAEQAFAVALFPVLQSNTKTCKSCHRVGVGIAPFFAESVVSAAWSALESTGKINLAAPSTSRIVAKVRDTSHNCGAAGCSADVADFEAAVVNMSILMQPPSAPAQGGGNGGNQGGNAGGGATIPGLTSIEAFNQSGLRTTLSACAACHGDGGSQIPFASSNIDNAHDALLSLVNLTGPNASGNSFIVQKIRGGHEGFSQELADDIEEDIRLWWGLMQTRQENGPPINSNRVFSGQVGLTEDAAVADPGSIYIEAESGQLAAPIVMMGNAAASGGAGINTPNNGQNTGTNNNSRAIYTFTIQEPGNYKIFGRALAPTDNDNSFHWRVDNNNFQAWAMPVDAAFQWDAFNNGGGDANGADSVVSLTAGLHTLEIRQREDGTFLDQILITNDLNANPAGAGVSAAAFELEFDISDIAGSPNTMLRVSIREFDGLSYIVSSPTIVATEPLVVKNLMVHVNNLYNPNDSTFTIIDAVVQPGETILAPYSMVLLKGPTPALDMFSVSFEEIERQ